MSSARKQYPFHLIEPKWQRAWDEQQTFRAWNPGEPIPPSHPFAQRHSSLPPKYYILDMFPYPSGAGLHVGHPEGYTATDILARFRRAQGYHVLHPMGWDAFGLPAEQYAIKTGQHPRETTEKNVATFTKQIKALGFSYDWTREVNTTDPEYFRWTQWIFLRLYNSWFNPGTNKAEPIETLPYPPALQVKPGAAPHLQLEADRRAYRDGKRLAYVSEAPVWWCEELGTVLANEEVIEGKSEVGGFPVVRKPMRQWVLRITAYAERLLQDLNTIDWTESLKEMQRNWIGRSEGAEVKFPIPSSEIRSEIPNSEIRNPPSEISNFKSQIPNPDAELSITVFTTRPDTLFGATYMVLAPEHKLVDVLTAPELRKAVAEYRAYASSKSDLERTELAKEKTGVFTGAYAINPVTNERIPIWIADYVLASYGTGAIMAVPAHDTRDLEFARKFNLPIRVVVQAPAGQESLGFVEDGANINSDFLNGLPTPEAKNRITAWLEERGLGKKTINYKLRDWLFSRQRYWGEPFPIVWRQDSQGRWFHEALPEAQLPLVPPDLTDFRPTSTGEPPLGRAKDWVNLPDGSVRETNTMPQWAGSCWYYLRYLDPSNRQAFCGREAEQYWMGAVSTSKAQAEGQSSACRPEPGLRNATSLPTPGVNLYVGGTEHAVLHLLYARFWHKVLYDLGHVSSPEPFFKLVNQGLILGELEYTAFKENSPDGSGKWVSADELAIASSGGLVFGRRKGLKVEDSDAALVGTRVSEADVELKEGRFVLKADTLVVVDARSFKMSKSRENVVNPDDVLAEYGADAFRLYEMFMGPLEMVKPWSTKGVEGVYRFLGRVWRLFVDEQSETEFEQNLTVNPSRGPQLLELIHLNPAVQEADPTAEQQKALHACIKKVTEDLEGMRFNTAISAMMVFINEGITWNTRPVSVLREFLALLQPFAPHLAEELWSKLAARAEVGGQRAEIAADCAGRSPEIASGTIRNQQFAIRNSQSIFPLSYFPWPQYDPQWLVEAILEIAVQVNGKLRDRIRIVADASEEQIKTAALSSEKVIPFLEGKTIRKIIVVGKRLVNIAVG